MPIIKTVIKMTKQAKRILSLYMLFTVCFMAILVRIVYINFSSYASAGQKQATRTVVVVPKVSGKFFSARGTEYTLLPFIYCDP